MSELTDSGNHEAAPYVGPDGDVQEANVLADFGNALCVAGDRVLYAAGRLKRARSEAERAAIRTEIRGFLRRSISAADIAFAVLGGSLPQPVTTEDP